MNLSKETLTVLKNFVGINDGLVFVPGKVQRTITSDQGVLAIANLTEDFPKRAAIVELSKFLSNVEVMDDAALDFADQWVEISGTASEYSLKYAYGAESLIKSPPDKSLDTSKAEGSFELPSAFVKRILKFSDINSLPTIAVGCDGTNNFIEAYDPDNPESARAKLNISKASDATEWRESFKAERFHKLMETDYKVSFVSKSFAIFETTTGVTYFIAADKK